MCWTLSPQLVELFGIFRRWGLAGRSRSVRKGLWRICQPLVLACSLLSWSRPCEQPPPYAPAAMHRAVPHHLFLATGSETSLRLWTIYLLSQRPTPQSRSWTSNSKPEKRMVLNSLLLFQFHVQSPNPVRSTFWANLEFLPPAIHSTVSHS